MRDERSTTAVDRKFGERIRARRREINMTQEQLAEQLGVTFQQVQKYEKGSNRIAASRLFDIAQALEVPITFFFDGISGTRREAKVAARPDDLFVHPGAVDLLRLYAAIGSDKLRRKVLALVRVMVEKDV